MINRNGFKSVTVVTIILSMIMSEKVSAQEPARPAVTPAARAGFRISARIVSPELHSDDKITFRVYMYILLQDMKTTHRNIPYFTFSMEEVVMRMPGQTWDVLPR
jgi:hypothetical protein